jgi:hypothetical protein
VNYALREKFRVPNSTIIPEWNALYNRAGRRNGRRNQLVHFAVLHSPANRPGYRYHLTPNIPDLRAFAKWGSKPPTLNLCQILASASSFTKLSGDLRHFALRMDQHSVTTGEGPSEESLPSKAHLAPALPSEGAPSDRAPGAPPEPSQE